MTDYVSREAVEDIVMWYDGQGELLKQIIALPSVQSERAKGEWKFDKERLGYWISTCSNCNHIFHGDTTLIYKPKFCPDCGADMRGERE